MKKASAGKDSRPCSNGVVWAGIRSSTFVLSARLRVSSPALNVRQKIEAALVLPAAEVAALHARHINPVFIRALDLLGFQRELSQADGIFVWDAAGRRYLDFLAGYGCISVGHNHPDVRAAIEAVLESRTPHFLLVSPQPLAAELARRLASIAPGDLDMCYLASSGSEAVEGALKLARLATKRSRFLAAENGYHGTTLGALSVTASRKHRAAFEPLLDCAIAPFGDTGAIERELRRRDIAAVILEPLQGEGGVRPAPAGFLSEVSRLCHRYGALFIIDEVQTGLGRCGRMFACEEEGIVPDVILLAKGLSGGMAPISAMLTRRWLWERAYGTLERYDLHCSTFSGGPIACAAALATLELLERDDLVGRADSLGRYLADGLRRATAGHRLVREVRGRGLFWGIELIAPWAQAAADLAGQWVVLGLLERGVLTQACSCAGHVVRVQPPLTVTREAIDTFLDALRSTLVEHATGPWKSLARAVTLAARNHWTSGPGEETHDTGGASR